MKKAGGMGAVPLTNKRPISLVRAFWPRNIFYEYYIRPQNKRNDASSARRIIDRSTRNDQTAKAFLSKGSSTDRPGNSAR